MELSSFLIKAKLYGYATGGEGNEIIREDGGKKFNYQERDFDYSDIYYGFNPFIGQEIVKKQDNVIWVMNYFGETTCGEKYV